MLTAFEHLLLHALRRMITEYKDEAESRPQEASCPECTLGTVPNHLNNGICPYHNAVVVMKKTED